MLVISRMILKMMQNVSKPALAGLAKQKWYECLDLGANIECGERNLLDFAELGSTNKSLFPQTN